MTIDKQHVYEETKALIEYLNDRNISYDTVRNICMSIIMDMMMGDGLTLQEAKKQLINDIRKIKVYWGTDTNFSPDNESEAVH
jgi:hypothetical protein